MLRWFVGLGPKPTFERWTYWEKFDFWAVVSIVVFIGTSGLVIWLPNLFARFVSGATLNEAQMVHYEISIMATSFVLAIRYINTHFRPEKFPMDLSVVTGLVSEEHLKRARPRFLDRLRKEGRLDSLRTRFPSRARQRKIIIAAGVAHVMLVMLLAIILVASLSK
jgi:cytochrome b subunit of formate dehydrogenase